jgi:hypothetical protein
MPARRFLWVIAILIMLVIAAAFAWRLFGDRLLETAMVPSAAYTPPPAASGPDYAEKASWAARPDLPDDAARWAPQGYAAAPRPGVAVFFVPPTAYFDRGHWNAPLSRADIDYRLDLFLRGEASIFNGVGAVWAPRYRQATFGAFLTDKPAAAQALDLAYGDVKAAFAAFLAAIPKDQPIILAGHSQGSRHLLHLLQDVVAKDPKLTARIVAVYAPGWPVSVEADLPALGLPPCTAPDETGCLLVWQSFAHDADIKLLRHVFDSAPGMTGAPRHGTGILCVNPIAGTATTEPQPAEANAGSLVPSADFKSGTLVPKAIPAACLPSGVLDIGPAPQGYNDFILPHDNYHVYDYPLFWANVRADAERRVDALAAAHHDPAAAVRPSAGEAD